jgi:hypothetical protein
LEFFLARFASKAGVHTPTEKGSFPFFLRLKLKIKQQPEREGVLRLLIVYFKENGRARLEIAIQGSALIPIF